MHYRSHEGGWALLDANADGDSSDPQEGLSVTGASVLVEQIGVTNSNPERTTDIAGSVFRSGEVILNAAGAKLRNSVVTDGTGISSWLPNTGGEVYGCLSLDGGWQGPDRGHTHCIYTQNAATDPRKSLKHNILIAPYSTCIKTSGNAGGVSNYDVVENTVMLASARATINADRVAIQHYSDDHASVGMEWRGNRAYQPVGTCWTSYFKANRRHQDCLLAGQWLYGGNGIMFVFPWDDITIVDHVIHADDASYLVALASTLPDNAEDAALGLLPSSLVMTGNVYFGGKAAPFRHPDAGDLTLAQWQSETGQDLDAEHYPSDLPPAQTWVDANEYLPHRAHITVWNPTEAASVEADLDSVLTTGDRWYLHNAWNPYAGPVASGIYTTGQGIEVPMSGITNRTPAGLDALPFDPKFHAFVVLPSATWVAA